MKILVYGAGVLGCNLARNLFRAGKDVTLLARGGWAEEIRRNGLRIKDKFSIRTSVSRIPVATELKPEDRYDVIFAVVRYTQIDSILDALRANATQNIVFVGNDVRARALTDSLPEKNVLFAFALSAGHRERDHVASIDLKKITIGQISGAPSNEALIGRIFDGTKYKVVYEPSLTIVLDGMAGYAIARRNTAYNKFVFSLLIGCMMIPGIINTVPLYTLMRRIGAVNTLLGMVLICSALAMPSAVFIYTTFIRALPIELDEAAEVDGCTDFRAFWKIIFPVLKPATIHLPMCLREFAEPCPVHDSHTCQKCSPVRQ